MSKDYLATTFKSGNSVAVRLPKGLGIEEGTQMRLREERGRFVLEPTDAPKRKFDIAKVAGSAPGLRLLADDERVIEERALHGDDR